MGFGLSFSGANRHIAVEIMYGNVNTGKTDVAVLCGGLGARLRNVVSGRPKILARIGEKTFLDILVDNLTSHGFRKLVLCTGYSRQQVKEYVSQKGYDLIFSEEDEPLGTGGAIKNARGLIKSHPFMVINGDSICNVDLREFMDYHAGKKGLLSIILAKSGASQDFGSVLVDKSGRITGFKEKAGGNSGLINAGIYLMGQDIFSIMPEQHKFSLEYDFFPRIVDKYNCYGFLTDNEVIDIGTPERYEKAVKLLK